MESNYKIIFQIGNWYIGYNIEQKYYFIGKEDEVHYTEIIKFKKIWKK